MKMRHTVRVAIGALVLAGALGRRRVSSPPYPGRARRLDDEQDRQTLGPR
jgi:hypothetical protein